MSEFVHVDHPYTDPGDGRQECETCGKWVWRVIHSCKGVPVTPAAIARAQAARPHPDPGEWADCRTWRTT